MDRTHKLMLEATRTRGRLRMVHGGKPRVVESQCFGMARKGTQLLRVHRERPAVPPCLTAIGA